MSTAPFFASPSVVALAGRMGVDLADVARATGRTHIAREDVEHHLQEAARHDQDAAKTRQGRQKAREC